MSSSLCSSLFPSNLVFKSLYVWVKVCERELSSKDRWWTEEMTRNDRQSHLGGFSEGHFSSLDDDDDGCFSEGHLNSLEDDASKLLRIDSVHSIFTIVDCHNHFHYQMSPWLFLSRWAAYQRVVLYWIRCLGNLCACNCKGTLCERERERICILFCIYLKEEKGVFLFQCNVHLPSQPRKRYENLTWPLKICSINRNDPKWSIMTERESILPDKDYLCNCLMEPPPSFSCPPHLFAAICINWSTGSSNRSPPC